MNVYTPSNLRNVSVLAEVPERELQWILDHGTLESYKEGDFLFKKGDPANHLYILMKGGLLFYIEQNGQRRDVGEATEGTITGLLPYSRLTTATGNGVVTKDIEVISIERKVIQEMIIQCPNLTTALVHHMTSRVREFTSSQQQIDKLASLGKLSAGLAHELNNPASAIVRSADVLKEHLGHVPERFKKVISMRLNEDSIDRVNHIASEKIAKGTQDLPMMERSSREDDLLDWLEDHDIDFGEDWVEQLVDFNFSIEDLEKICEATGAQALGPSLGWLVNVLTTEKLVEEIKDASTRISDLVQSVKNYSYMDRSTDKQMADPTEGIRNTVRMLEHKARRNGVQIEEDFSQNIGEIFMFPSEMNQVWTNILDNALDALETSPDAKILIQTSKTGKTATISISDNGPGIPEDVQQHIFDPFYTTKEMGKGTGLGLDVVKRIVDRHGGRIELSSMPGKTEFKIVLPIDL